MISGALHGAGKSGCRSVDRLLPAGQALENAPDVEQRPGIRWASSFYGWLSLGGLVLLGRGSGRNDAEIRASPAGRWFAKIPGAPCPVQGVCWRSSKCQTGEAIHNAMSTTTSTTSTTMKAKERKATQPVPKKLLHLPGAGVLHIECILHIAY